MVSNRNISILHKSPLSLSAQRFKAAQVGTTDKSGNRRIKRGNKVSLADAEYSSNVGRFGPQRVRKLRRGQGEIYRPPGYRAGTFRASHFVSVGSPSDYVPREPDPNGANTINNGTSTSKTISCLVENMSTVDDVTTFTVSEMPDWSFENPRAILRYQDGTASGLMVTTRVGNFGVSVPHLTDFDNIIIGNPSIEPPRLIFCESTSAGYNAIVSEISPQSDGTCQVTAKEYRDSFYDYDNAAYPGDVA